jgi:hypothetical protein
MVNNGRATGERLGGTEGLGCYWAGLHQSMGRKIYSPARLGGPRHGLPQHSFAPGGDCSYPFDFPAKLGGPKGPVICCFYCSHSIIIVLYPYHLLERDVGH